MRRKKLKMKTGLGGCVAILSFLAFMLISLGGYNVVEGKSPPKATSTFRDMRIQLCHTFHSECRNDCRAPLVGLARNSFNRRINHELLVMWSSNYLKPCAKSCKNEYISCLRKNDAV